MTAAVPVAKAQEETLAEFVINSDNTADILVNGIKKAEISPEGNVKVFDDTGIHIQPIPAPGKHAAKENPGQIQISEDGKSLTINRATIEPAEDGQFLIRTPGTAQLQPFTVRKNAAQLAAEAKAAAAAKAEEEAPFPVGGAVPGGFVYLGEYKDRQLFAAPEDFVGTYKEAETELKKLQKKGVFAHIADKGELKAVYNRRAALKGLAPDDGREKKGHYACYSSNRNFYLVFADQKTGRNFADGQTVNCLKDEKHNYRFVYTIG